MSTAATPLNVQTLFRTLEASGDWDVEEALFLTFNADVAFLERGILGLCRSMGARVTVIADAGIWHPDPLTMKGAGTEYLVGLAAHRGAFHPKLALLVGKDRVLALVGSGNLTMGGWQHNSELWSVLRAEDGHAPQALFALAGWLELLPRTVRLASDHADALNRVAARLRATLGHFFPVDDGVQLITNLDQSVLSQLPAGPVDELTLCAPFIDDHASAVRALVEHFPTPKFTLVVQPGLTVVEPHALATVLSGQKGLTIVADNSRRYRHAKLVEWRRGPHRQALTGSANLSAAAMLNTVGRGGNVELGILTTIDEPLWPDPQLDPGQCVRLENITDVPAVRIGSRESESAESTLPQLLSAALSGNELGVELAYPVPFSVEVHYTNNPLNEAWTPIGTISAGHTSATFPAGGVRDSALLRLNWMVSDRALPAIGPTVPASVPERLRIRPTAGRAGGGIRIRTRDDLLGDDLRYLDAFAVQLSQIHEDVAALRNPSTRPDRKSSAPVDARDRVRFGKVILSGGQVAGVRATDTETSQQCSIRARDVATAIGPWTGHLGPGTPNTPIKVRPSKGVHILFPKYVIDIETGLLARTRTGLLFVVPWRATGWWAIQTLSGARNLIMSWPIALMSLHFWSGTTVS
ncbi:hypothetical protein ACFQ36_03410 [Arthrobacter sp. GCM10027362]|uniref:hypothetical protein n=1 Tax=Arthrobacter sp. GCM10027362 TaxID=3273379 RepID=UPI003634B0B8